MRQPSRRATEERLPLECKQHGVFTDFDAAAETPLFYFALPTGGIICD
jgi:hypothetical protein